MPDRLVRLATPDGLAVAVAPDGDLAAARRLPVPSVAHLLSGDAARFADLLGHAGEPVAGPVRLLPPVDGLTEVWAAGVTYRRSSEARQEESQVADVYARVYEADRPELFLKAAAWRVSGDGEPVGIRADSAIDVPEPELALVCAASGEVVALTVCDDVSSRSIEGENPLYLPQAKIYTGSCGLGPGLVPIAQAGDPLALTVDVEVLRDGLVVWQATTPTSAIHRPLDDLVEHLFRHNDFPHGAVLSTGTGLVPGLDWSLTDGDVVRVAITGLGTLTNPVRTATDDAFAWLSPDPLRSP